MAEREGQHQGYVTGFFLGVFVGGAALFLFATPSGRRLTRKLLEVAEEVAENGDLYISKKAKNNMGTKYKKAKTLGSVITKLKKEVKSSLLDD